MQLRFVSGLGPASRFAPLLFLPLCLWRVGGGKPSRVKEPMQERLDWLKWPQFAGEAGGHFLWLEWTEGSGKIIRVSCSQVFGKYVYFAVCGLTLKASKGPKYA